MEEIKEETVQPVTAEPNAEILNQIEERLKHSSILTPKEIETFLKSLSQKYGKKKLLDLLESTLKTKKVFYIRHAQSTYNKWALQSAFNFSWTYPNKVENYNPVLTPEGVEQCRVRVEALDKEKPFEAELIMVSPLTRAIQTMNELRKSTCFANTKTIIVTQLLRERLDACGDIGKSKSDIMKDFEDLDFSYISKEDWWNYLETHSVKKNSLGAELFARESEKDAKARVALTFLWLAFRPERSVVLVSHSGFYRAIYDIGIFGKKAKNVQCVNVESDRIIQSLTAYL